MLRLTSRTYAQAVAGDIKLMRFNTTTADFLLTFQPKQSCTLPTEIYLNEALHYPNGSPPLNSFCFVCSFWCSYTVAVLPRAAATWSSLTPNYITVVTKSYSADISIIISAL